MSLLSTVIVVAEDSDVEECLSSSEQAARETNANVARQDRIRFLIMEVLKLVPLARAAHACAPVEFRRVTGSGLSSLSSFSR